MTVAICDDESYWRQNLTIMLDEYKRQKHIDIFVYYFSSGNSLLKSPKEFDIVFMDYQMNSLNGIETAQAIRKTNDGCIIVFVSAYPSVALDAFEVDAFRFLAKPIDKTKLFKCLDDYRKQNDRDNFLIIRSQDGIIKAKMSEIIYCEAIEKHTIIHTQKETIEVAKNIKEIEKMLPSEKFFRCHKAFITSFYHIKSFDTTEINYANNDKAFISRRLLPSFRNAFQEYIIKYNMEKV